MEMLEAAENEDGIEIVVETEGYAEIVAKEYLGRGVC